MEAVDAGMVTEWPQTLIWAAFATPDGAIDALERLQAARSTWRIRIDNAAVVVKHADGSIAVNETGDRSGLRGLGGGALIGGLVGLLFPPALLAGAAVGAASGGLGARLRDAGFEDNALRAVANELAPGSSLLLAVISQQWADEAEAALKDAAYHAGQIEVTKNVADLAQFAAG
jgi:uncharacterized membrane protein